MNAPIEFQLRDFMFRKSFSTPASIGYIATPIRKIGLSLSQKWIEIHYPCDGHIKAQIRGTIQLNSVEINEFIFELFEAINMPKDETFEANFFTVVDVKNSIQYVDRHGKADRIETTRKFSTPAED